MHSGSGRPKFFCVEGISPWCRWILFRQNKIRGYSFSSAEDGAIGCLICSSEGGVEWILKGWGFCSLSEDVMADGPLPLFTFLMAFYVLRGLCERMLWASEPRGKVQMKHRGFVLRRDGPQERFSFVGIVDSSQTQVMVPEIKDQSQGEVYFPIFIKSLCKKSICI